MFRPRGNTNFSRKPSIDPIIGNELSKLAKAMPLISYGDQFPGRNATFGDMHFYTGDDTTSYKKNNWYIRPVDPNSNWQSMNATSVIAENIQAGTIGSGVKVTDSLQLLGGDMLGIINFFKDQKFPAAKIGPGTIPDSVLLAGYVPETGGIYTGNIDMSDHYISSIQKLYGYDNLIFIDMSVDGNLTLGSDVKMSLISPLIELTGGLHVIGNSVFTGDVTATGTIEGEILTDGVFVVQNGVITGASGLISQFTNDAGYQTSLAGDPVFLTQLEPQQFTDGALVGTGCIYLQNGVLGIIQSINPNGNDLEIAPVGDTKIGDPATCLVVEPDGDTYWKGSGAGMCYGSMYADNAGIAVVIAVADTFVEVGSGITGGLTNRMTFQNAKELKCLVAGTYLINWSLSALTSAVANKECEGAVMINGTAQPNGSSHAEVSPGGSNRPETVSGTGIFTLAVNDLVSLAVSNHTDTTDFVVEHLSLTALQIGG